MTDTRPPYICITKKFPKPHIETWCGRNISTSPEVRYGLELALEKRDPITCPECLSIVRETAHQSTTSPLIDFGWQEAILPFVGLGLFWVAILPGKEFTNDNFYNYSLPLMLASILVLFYTCARMLRKSRQADRIGQETLEALLEKSPNRKTDD